MRLRRTKIVATLGPQSSSPDVLDQMIRAGVDVVRINCSHGDLAQLEALVKTAQGAAHRMGVEIAILMDLQGPKIRIARFKKGFVDLKTGDTFCLDAGWDPLAGTTERVGIDYLALPTEVFPGDVLLMDDGRIAVKVRSVSGGVITTEVLEGGILSDQKGIGREGGGLSAESLTEKDKMDLALAAELQVDFVALSFVKTAEDVTALRFELARRGATPAIVAKIERCDAIAHLDEIILASDAVMVARGDLGVELGDAQLPGIQKKIIRRARALDRVVITATQMMDSMITSAVPTRAEVFDVANAVLDGTDAVMLSAETAKGRYPVKVVQKMAAIALGAEKERMSSTRGRRMESWFKRPDEAVAMATMYVGNHMAVAAIIALTESGSTPLWMSRIRSGIPIFALCRHPEARRRMRLCRGVYPVAFDASLSARDALEQDAMNCLRQLGFLKANDWVILTKGDHDGMVEGCSNTIKIFQVDAVG